MDSYIYGKNSVEFVTVCVEFCAFIERAPETKMIDFTTKAVKLLPLLYLKASLVEPEECYDDYPERFVSEEFYNGIRYGIENVLGTQDAYLEVFIEGMQYSDTPITASISEDLADIYQCIKDFISVYRLGNDSTSRAALTACAESFREYWGQKAVNVMRPLHTLCYSDKLKEDYDYDYDEENNGNTLYREEGCNCGSECECGSQTERHIHGEECGCDKSHG
ncbi:MAG: DUF5063 domain-containing protein [Bacteroidales bacterium]